MEYRANLRGAPKLKENVVHPGKCKQNVRVALVIFEPSTVTANKHNFVRNADSAEFLDLVKTWWVISNSRGRFKNRNKLGNAAVRGDGKPQILGSLASCLENWRSQQVSNAQKCTLIAQTNAALLRTLQCHIALIKDLLSNGQEYVFTARFQSDPIERLFGGRFFISEKNINISDKSLKIKALIKEGVEMIQQ